MTVESQRKKLNSMLIKIKNIHIDGGTQTRAELNQEIIHQYEELMLEETQFPPVTIFYDGENYWLADGFHRIKASIKAGFVEIESDIKQGTQRDAILYSVGANNTHGLRRTNADKRRAVMLLLEDSEWQKWSDNKIANQCGVGHTLVNEIRNSIFPKSKDKRIIERNGKVYEMNTTNIGKNQNNDSENINFNKEVNNEYSENGAPTRQLAEQFNDSIIIDIDHVDELVNEMHDTILRRFRKLNKKDYNRAITNLINLLNEVN